MRAWLYTIARNRCLSVLRARRETPVDDLDELPTENLSAEVQRRQDLRDLLHDVGGLPEEQRAALVLAEVGGVSHDEIAQVLGVQREKVKALVFQARSSLIASRDARETPCEDIRMQLAELRGGALRRNSLRRHLKVCPGCRDFRAAVQDQRKMLALALPVAPTLLLKQGVMAGALGSGAAAAGGTVAAGGLAGAAGGGSLLAGGGAAVTAKVLAIAAIAGGGAAGFKAAVPDERPAAPTVPTAPAAQGGADRGAGTSRPAGDKQALGGAAPAAVGSREQQPSDAGSGVAERRSEQRSHGRHGTEQRSERADERAAGPNPEVVQEPAKPVNERSLERGDGSGPGEKSQGGPSAPSASRRCVDPSVEKLEQPRRRSARHPRSARRPRSRRSRRSRSLSPSPRPSRSHLRSRRPRRFRPSSRAPAPQRQRQGERQDQGVGPHRPGRRSYRLCGARSPPDARRGRSRRP